MLLENAREIGRGRPHAEAPQCQPLPPTMATLREVQKSLMYLVSLEFAIGNLDALQQEGVEVAPAPASPAAEAPAKPRPVAKARARSLEHESLPMRAHTKRD